MGRRGQIRTRRKISRKGAKWMTTKYTKDTKVLQKGIKKTKMTGETDAKQHTTHENLRCF